MADDFHQQHKLETYKSLITVSVEGFKFLALANGGGAVALLAYLGNVAGKSPPAPDLTCPIGVFVAGVMLCGLAMVFSYATQLTLYNEKPRDGDTRGPHQGSLWAAMVLFVLSLIAFAIGSISAAVRLHGG